MYAVIFRAELGEVDQAYFEMAEALRAMAMHRYGCEEFTSVTENGREITISYWKNLEDIERWKNAAAHSVAQQRARSKWYRRYQVQVVEIVRGYGGGG